MSTDDRLAQRLLLVASGLVAAACSDPAADPDDAVRSIQSPVVYGTDDRTEPFAHPDPEWAAAALQWSVALIEEDAIDLSDPARARLSAPTLADGGLCGDERFSAQPTAAFCSGSLIRPDLVLTAGHCVSSAADCAGTRFVFGYAMTGPDRLAIITAADVFECAGLVAQRIDDEVDFAVVRLDRPVDRQAAAVAREPAALPAGTPLLASGFPLGLPLKLDDGGAVRDGGEAPLAAFVAEVDTFAGSSGSAVLDAATRELVGIVTAGERDLEHDPVADCDRVRVCPERGGGGERIVHAARAIQALCDAIPGADLCRCGDGACDGAVGEDSATCATDCGDECGDGVCNGVETSSACPEDCGDPSIPSPGDTCEGAIDLTAPSTTQVVDGTTLDLADDHGASCGGAGSPDRVHRFALAEPSRVEVTAAGYDTVLYLRSDCADPATELACNDDAVVGDPSSAIRADLEAGTYYLFVDGYACEAGRFTLTVTAAPRSCGDDGACAGCAVGGGAAASLSLAMLVALACGALRARARGSARPISAPWRRGGRAD